MLRKGTGKWMRDKGVRKEVGYSWVDTGDADGSLYLHGFSSGDTVRPSPSHEKIVIDKSVLDSHLNS
ncbi:unnamed protein product [Prunus armeniaca]